MCPGPFVAGGLQPALNVGAPVELFQSPIPSLTMSIDQYAPSKDGQRFLFIRPRATPGARLPIVVVMNWTQGLQGR
jgi:hypothetical protein